VYVTTKGDRKVWVYDTRRERIDVLHDPAEAADSPISAVDNLTVTPTGDLLIAEDQVADQELVLITADGAAVPLLRMTGHEGSELAGPAFSPDSEFLYFSSQRGGGGPGITYAVTGPFAEMERKKKNDVKTGALPPGGPTLALIAAGGLWKLRTRD
jgi:uncharacterized protein